MCQTPVRKLKANTLVEVMIALALTSFAATLAVVIYLNIEKSTLPFFRIRATQIATSYLETAVSEKDYFDRTAEIDGFFIKKKVNRHPVFTDCSNITVTVFDREKKKLSELHTCVHSD